MKKDPNYRIQNRELRIETTNMCNAHCVMCPREKMKRPVGILDMKLFMRVVDEAYELGASIVSLGNYGEAFLDPYIFERAAYIKAKGMSVYVLTNGSMVDKKAADRVILYFDKIRFSAYGTTKEVFEKVHRKLNYEKCLENARYLVDERNRRKSRSPKIEVYFLMMEENKHQAEDFKKRWMNYADDIAIWRPHNWGDGRKYRIFDRTEKKVTCGRPDNSPVQVQWDGTVVPCCYDYDSNMILGDLTRNSLYEVLTGEEYNKLRKAHNEGNFHLYPFCDQCDQLRKKEDVLVFTTIKQAKVGAVNTTYDVVEK